jgi:hypothetical protein
VIGADIALSNEGEQFRSVVIFHAVPCKRINNDFNVRIGVRRTRLLGNGCEEAFLIDDTSFRDGWMQKRSGGLCKCCRAIAPTSRSHHHLLNGLRSPFCVTYSDPRKYSRLSGPGEMRSGAGSVLMKTSESLVASL